MSDPSPVDARGEHETRPGLTSSIVGRQQGQEERSTSSNDSTSVGDSVDASGESRPDGDRQQSPLGIPAIQGGCGYLVAVKEDGNNAASGMTLVGLSSNISDSPWWSRVGSSSAAELLGKDLADVFRPEFTETVRALLQRHQKSPDALSLPQKKTHGELISPDDFEKSDQILTCSLAPRSTGVYLLEVELVRGSRHHQLGPERTPSPDPGLLHVAHMMRSIPVGSTPQLCTTVLCDALKEVMPAYDRVMVYRFAADGSAEVIHESTQPGSTTSLSFLGLRFPAGDAVLPVAHELLLKRNDVRFIADTFAQVVPVVSNFREQHGGAQLDVSMTALKAPAEGHRRYVRSMGVTANMVVAIVVHDELWGLFTFHSYGGAVVPTIMERVMVEIAAALSAKAIAHYELERTVRLSRTLDHVNSYTRVQDFLAEEHRALLGILDLDSIVMWEPQESVLAFGDGGVTLSAEECESLVAAAATAAAAGDHKHISLRSMETKGVAFFSVRSFLLAFVRESLSHRASRRENKPEPPPPPPPPLRDDGRARRPVGAEMATGWEAWSRRTVTLLGIMRHGLSSQLYAEALSADNMEMLAHVSHELRTPFHGVMSSLEALREERHSLGADEKDDILRSAMDAGNSMLVTLDHILDMAKAQNSTELAVDRFVASRPILQTISAMNQFATKKSLEFTTTVGTALSPSPASSSGGGGEVEQLDSLEVTGDERRIKDIMQNLVSNAIKFTPDGGKVHTSLLTFDSLADANAWWRRESGRFHKARWNGPTGVNTAASADEGGGAAAGDGGRGGLESSESSPPRPRWYVYCVEDNGVGILPADFGRLVAKYRQISTATSKGCSGTGLGLHVSNLHVSLMSGSLGIASSFAGAAAAAAVETPAACGGGGTLFAVVLPLCPAAPLPPAAAEHPVAVGSADKRAVAAAAAAAGATENKLGAPSSFWGNPPNRKLTFLVVDDHKLNIKLLQRKIQLTFEDSDVQVLTATDGVLAMDTLAAVRESTSGEEGEGDSPPPFLAGIFLDFHMPNMSGVECTKRIRQAEAENCWPKVFISGCTADLTESSRESFLGAGGDSILIKPWGPGQVERMCHQMLAHAMDEENEEEEEEAEKGEGGGEREAQGGGGGCMSSSC